MTISLGAQATQRFTVTDEDTAIALGSGDVPVLGTPRVVAWCEAVTVMAVASELHDGQTTVGYKINLDHLSPSPVGAEVSISAEVSEANGKQVTFQVEMTDQNGRAAAGTIVRVVVDRHKFVDRLTS